MVMIVVCKKRNTVAKLKQGDKRKAGIQVAFQEENDLMKVDLATSTLNSITNKYNYPRKGI